MSFYTKFFLKCVSKKAAKLAPWSVPTSSWASRGTRAVVRYGSVVHHMGSSRPVFLGVEVGFHLKKAKIEIGIGKFHDISTSFANKTRHYFLLGGCKKKLHFRWWKRDERSCIIKRLGHTLEKPCWNLNLEVGIPKTCHITTLGRCISRFPQIGGVSDLLIFHLRTL